MALSRTQKKTITIVAAFVVVIGIAAAVVYTPKKAAAPIVTAPVTTPVTETKPATTTPTVPATVQGEQYHTIVMGTTTAAKELAQVVGQDNVAMVLELNRIDAVNVKKGAVLVVPNDFSDTAALSPFPTTVAIASDIPKLMMIDQAVQAFAIYESGTLVRWGAISSGKQSTPTANKLYFTNWKGKEVHSSFSDEWILKWNFNLDNKEGIGMHQYEMPGYPASHSCVRMFAADAEWIYNWADQWVLTDDEQTILQYGTPVIVFGQYPFGKTAPWKNLAKDASATTVSTATLENTVSKYKDEIVAKRAQ